MHCLQLSEGGWVVDPRLSRCKTDSDVWRSVLRLSEPSCEAAPVRIVRFECSGSYWSLRQSSCSYKILH